MALSARRTKGITLPHHYRVFWGRDGAVNLQSKRWLTSPDWSTPVQICDAAQLKDLVRLWPPTQEPQWEPGFQKSAEAWVGKLRGLLESASMDVTPLEHTVAAQA